MVRRASILFLFVLVIVAAVPPQSTVSLAQGDATPPATASASPVSTIDFALLTESQVPNGLAIIDDRERSLDEVTANFSDPAAAREQFEEWGWRRNVIRAFHVPAGTSLGPGEIDGIYIRIHEFGTPQSAADALTYSFDVQAAGTGLEEIPIDPLGASSSVLYGTLAYGNEITIYVQHSALLIRLSASSPEGDPRAETTVLMRTMLEDMPPS